MTFDKVSACVFVTQFNVTPGDVFHTEAVCPFCGGVSTVRKKPGNYDGSKYLARYRCLSCVGKWTMTFDMSPASCSMDLCSDCTFLPE